MTDNAPASEDMPGLMQQALLTLVGAALIAVQAFWPSALTDAQHGAIIGLVGAAWAFGVILMQFIKMQSKAEAQELIRGAYAMGRSGAGMATGRFGAMSEPPTPSIGQVRAYLAHRSMTDQAA